METNRTGPGAESDEATARLIALLRSRDPEAAALLDSLYRDALIRFCWGYLGGMEEAEDAVQEVCYKVLAAPHIPDHFRAWIYKTARNYCLNLLRERASEPAHRVLPTPSVLADSLTGHLTRLVKQEMHSRLVEQVGRLSEAQREVLRLRYVENLSRADIAEVLEQPERVIKSRLFEGLKRLRDCALFLQDT